MYFTSVNDSQDINLGCEVEKCIDRHLNEFPFHMKDLAYIFEFGNNKDRLELNSLPSSPSSSQYSSCGSDIDEDLALNPNIISGFNCKSVDRALFDFKSNSSFSDVKIHNERQNFTDCENIPKQCSNFGPFNNIPPLPSSKNSHLLAFRQSLPTWNLKRKILDSIKQNPVTLITGGTGCGKTTQVPQFLLENAAENALQIRIMCTQPRRLPAISIAKRVAMERGESIGDVVGYHIRLEQRISSKTALTYCTSGVLLRKLTNDELASDITHVILDEIHERETNTDYLLIVLRLALSRRPDLRVVLMSATMGDNIKKFLNYFEKYGIVHIDIPSRVFHVDCYYLPEIIALTGYKSKSSFGMFTNGKNGTSQLDVNSFNHFESSNINDQFPNGASQCDTSNSNSLHVNQMLIDRPPYFDKNFLLKFRVGMLLLPHKSIIDMYLDSGGRQWRDSVDVELVVATIKYLIDSPVQGAIIVFLPGYEEICNVYYRIISLSEQGKFNSEPIIFTLHSQINTNSQQKVFEHVKKGQRKVILSTNIAEASLTVDDIVFVIDSGKAKEKSYDPSTHVARLNCRWIAQSNAEQRKGRAGRCQSGYCFRLYSLDDYNKMESTQIPEIKRIAIHEVCLHAKMSAPGGLNVQEFLRQAPDPPDDLNIEKSLEFLEILGALQSPQSWDELTPFDIQLDDNKCSTTQRNPNHRSRGTFYQKMCRTNNISPKSRIHYNIGDTFSDNITDTKEAAITELGKIIARLPLEPQLARLLLFGFAFKCLNPITTLVAAVSYRDPFLLTIGNSDDTKRNAMSLREKLCKTDLSDHLMLIHLFNEYESQPTQFLKEKFCGQNLVSEHAMRMIYGIKNQLLCELKLCHLIQKDVFRAEDDPILNKYSDSWPMVQAVIVAGSYPNIGYVQRGSKFNRIRTHMGKSSILHSSSSLKKQLAPNSNESNFIKRIGPEYFAFHEAMAKDDNVNNQHSIKTVTAVPQIAVLLFAGPIRMAAQALAYFELIDPNGHLKQKRKDIRDEKIAKWKEQCEIERSLWNDRNIIINIDDSSVPVDVKDEELPPSLKDEEFLHLDQWFGFKGEFDGLQRVLRLRCRIMDLLIRTLSFGQIREHDEALLDCVNQILCIAHETQGFNPVRDLSKSPPQRKIHTLSNSKRTSYSGINIERIR